MPKIDHIVWIVPSLEAGIEDLSRRLGVRAAVGGQHPRWGTHNALLGLGDGAYLEILSPDPAAERPDTRRHLRLDERTTRRTVTWAVATDDIEGARDRLRAFGIELGEIGEGSRRRTDGSLLTWRIAGFEAPREGGVVPFLIDWGDTPHPSRSAPAGCSLAELRLEHPEAARVEAILRDIGLDVLVAQAAASRVIARIRSPQGAVELG